jgi:uncharacterized SAM-binding protein YcdF (DUF218 family)
MIYLHKILPYFAMPSTFAIVLVLAGCFLRKRFLIIVGLCVLYIFSIPVTAAALFNFLEAGSKRVPADEAPAADAVVVLSGAGVTPRGESKVIEWRDPDRFFGGIQLYFAGKAPLLVFTGGWLPWDASARPEGEVLVEEAGLMGIPTTSMITTGKVSNTKQEADAVAQILLDVHKRLPNAKQSAAVRIILVTSAYHMRRAKMLFERAGLEVVPFPVDFKSSPVTGSSIFQFLPNAGALDASETAIREIYGRLYYRFKS